MDYILREIVKNTNDIGFNDDLLRAADYIVELEQRLAAAESKLPRWIPVGERMPKDKKPIYMIALVPERNYTTDQYAGWYILGEWSRWPHRFPPTHWSYQIDNPEGDL